MTHKAIKKQSAETHAQLQGVLDASANGILLLDKHGEITHMNRQCISIWRLPVALCEALQAVDGKTRATNDIFTYFVEQIRAPEIRRQWQTKDWHGDNTPSEKDESAQELVLNDGRCIEFRSRLVCLGKQVTGRILIFTDITRRKEEDAHLKLIASAFCHAHEGIVITNAAGEIIDVNAAFSRITGYAREEMIGKNPRILKSGEHGDFFYKTMWQKLTLEGYWQGEVWNRHKDGQIYAQRLSITAIRDTDSGLPLYYVAFTSDITESKRQQQQLERMAHYDALTDIPNRVLFADRLHQAIAHAHRNQNELALVYLDIDGFKDINDMHGHETGDQLLIAIARRWRAILRESDTLARLGGDEFVAVLSDLKTPSECEAVLSRLLSAAATPFEIGGHVLQISASLGAALFPDDGENSETLMRHADQAMYQAKQYGKNRYHLYDHEKDHILPPSKPRQ